MFIVTFLVAENTPLFAGSLMPDFICETGLKFYQQGQKEEALRQFQKALIVQPGYGPALEYIRLIQGEQLPAQELPQKELPAIKPKQSSVITGKKKLAVEPKAQIKTLSSVQTQLITQSWPASQVLPAEQTWIVTPVSSASQASFTQQVSSAALALAAARATFARQLAATSQHLASPQAFDQEAALPAVQPLPAVVVLPGSSSLADQRATFMQQASYASGVLPTAQVLPVAEVSPGVVAQITPAAGVGSVSGVSSIPPAKKKIVPIEVFKLDDSLKMILLPIEVEQEQPIIISGNGIQRFLITESGILSVDQQNSDEILVTGKELGYTYLYVWDDNGRWSLEFLTVPPKPEGLFSEESLLLEEEKARNFKLRYSLDWSSSESGRRVKSLNRGYYSWAHGLSLTGPFPYGDLDAGLNVLTVKDSTDLTSITLGLTNGHLGNFKGFALRLFDYSVPYSNLTFPGTSLKGAMFTSPAFNQKLNYNVFWGRESSGRYGNLSPSLVTSKDAYYKGINIGYSPQKQYYNFTFVEGWGSSRESFLYRRGYDLQGMWNFEQWKVGHEIAYDSERFANLFRLGYQKRKLNFNAELRNIDKKFTSITGNGWRQGELGGLFSLYYAINEQLSMRSTLDVFQDRLFPAEDNPNRWNEDFTWDASYQIDPMSTVGVNYGLQNDLGRVSQARYQSAGLNYSRRFKILTDIATYINYYHQENTNYSSPSSNYINDKVFGGIRVKLIDNLYYYANREFNWLQEEFYSTRATPNAFETGVDWSSKIGQSPFYGTMRFSYRDERDTQNNLSFYSGEDYIQAFSELAYRPSSGKEAYVSANMRNIWGEDPRVAKRLEMNFNFGLRYLWDTGFSWDSIGSIEGYVFKDLNSDGLKQKGEAPVSGARILLGKDKSRVTDDKGFYQFKNIKATKIALSFDSATLPSGFVLTVPTRQDVYILHHQAAKVNFGIISRSEISGIVFEDTNGNSEYDRQDKGMQGVVISLESGLKIITDSSGKYNFPNVPPGEHTITLDLNSLPLSYIPAIPVFKKIELSEGASYFFNIPLNKTEK